MGSNSDTLDHFSNVRRSRMAMSERDLETNLALAIERKDYAEVASLYEQGADLVTVALHSEGEGH